MQAVRAASEAQQTPTATEASPLPLRAGAKLTSLRKPPAAKPTKAKPVIIRKRAQPASDEEAQQVGAAKGAAAPAGHLVPSTDVLGHSFVVLLPNSHKATAAVVLMTKLFSKTPA